MLAFGVLSRTRDHPQPAPAELQAPKNQMRVPCSVGSRMTEGKHTASLLSDRSLPLSAVT
jgi:hypothetical protein